MSKQTKRTGGMKRTNHPCCDCGAMMLGVGANRWRCDKCRVVWRQGYDRERGQRAHQTSAPPSGPLPKEGAQAYTSSALLHAPAEIAARIINKILSGENLYVG